MPYTNHIKACPCCKSWYPFPKNNGWVNSVCMECETSLFNDPKYKYLGIIDKLSTGDFNAIVYLSHLTGAEYWEIMFPNLHDKEMQKKVHCTIENRILDTFPRAELTDVPEPCQKNERITQRIY